MPGLEWRTLIEGGHTLVELGHMLMQRLEEAHQLALEDVNRCKTDLQVASNCIFALENEYTGILNKARYCDRDSPHEVRVLRTRLDDYLTQEHIRPRLRSALDDLEICRQKLDKDADKFRLWPWKKKEKQQAVTAFARLLQKFHKYYNELAAKGLALEDNPSAFNWWVLNELNNYLADADDTRPPAKVVAALKTNPRAKQGHVFLKKTNEYIAKLERAFNN